MLKQIKYVTKTDKQGTAKVVKPKVVKTLTSLDANGNHKATIIDCKNGVNMKPRR